MRHVDENSRWVQVRQYEKDIDPYGVHVINEPILDLVRRTGWLREQFSMLNEKVQQLEDKIQDMEREKQYNGSSLPEEPPRK